MADHVSAIQAEEPMAAHRHRIEALLGGTLIGALVAAGAATLAIIALAGLFPQMLLDIAVIGVGAAFLFEGASIAAGLSDLLHELQEGKLQSGELVSGTTGETLAGMAGVALGILALLGVVPQILVPSAVMVFGVALMIGAGANVRLNALRAAHHEQHPLAQRVTHEAVRATASLQVLGGLAAITLGILALTGMETLTLSIVGMLSVSAVFLLADTAVAGRMMAIFEH